MSDQEKYSVLLKSEVDQPQTLDLLWSAYAETKNEAFIVKIVSVLDWKDNVRERLETWLQHTDLKEYLEYQQKFVDWMFPIDFYNRTVNGPLDIDLQVALLAKNGDLKFDELPFHVSMEELICLSMKSAALWSLLSMSMQDKHVANVCKKEALYKGGAARNHLANAGLS